MLVSAAAAAAERVYVLPFVAAATDAASASASAPMCASAAGYHYAIHEILSSLSSLWPLLAVDFLLTSG